jgi:hypothetical protein
METTTLEGFYEQTSRLIPEGINKEIGHFNVFKTDDVVAQNKKRSVPVMPYNRRAYYKISIISGRNKAEYADKVVDIEKNALLFATPKIPYNWVPLDDNQSGYFCIFTDEFLIHSKSGVVLDDLPIFRPGGYPIFLVTDEEAAEIGFIFSKMYKEISSDYVFKHYCPTK